MGATAVLLSVALNPSIGLGPAEMQCGFPAVQLDEPMISLDIEMVGSLYGGPGAMPVHLLLSTGSGDLRMAALAQPLGPASAPYVVIAGTPMQNVYFSLGLKGDGSASLTIRDVRQGEELAAEVSRDGTCHDHESFFLGFAGI